MQGPALRPRRFPQGLRLLTAPLVFLASVGLKLGSLAKFAALFVAFGGYALIWGWKFALGLIGLIFVHEMGHFLEASREHLHPSWPIFVPFLGAYVRYTRGNPWQTARVALAGPILGGLAGLACYVAGRAEGSTLLVALGYFGFVLNLINLLPFGILDGGSVWRSTRWLWRGGGTRESGDRRRALRGNRRRAGDRRGRGVRAPAPALTEPERQAGAPACRRCVSSCASTLARSKRRRLRVLAHPCGCSAELVHRATGAVMDRAPPRGWIDGALHRIGTALGLLRRDGLAFRQLGAAARLRGPIPHQRSTCDGAGAARTRRARARR